MEAKPIKTKDLMRSLFFKENKYLPGVALGLRDLAGTGIFLQNILSRQKDF